MQKWGIPILENQSKEEGNKHKGGEIVGHQRIYLLTIIDIDE